jgi:2-oxoglutarate dehydrogenase E2 component (dihydrolipoamide succinyltransferase)
VADQVKPVEAVMPPAGESVSEGQVTEWKFAVGDFVKQGDVLVDVETAKVNAELFAPVSGTLTQILKNAGDIVNIGEPMALIIPGDAPSAAPKAATPAPAAAPAASGAKVMPAAQRLAEQQGVNPSDVAATGPRGHVTKGDVIAHIDAVAAPKPAPKAAPAAPAAPAAARAASSAESERRVPMSPLRREVARRLVEAQQTAAILTTFNEIDMTGIMEARKRYQDAFTKRNGAKLGFMSFFVKACVDALKRFPAMNAEIQGTDIVYKNFQHVGVAVGGGRGLVVPVIRHAESLSFAEIELEINRLAALAKDNKLTMADLTGGTFTISNGGIYGSMLSTPIINPPQTGILGMHNITERPVAINGQVVIRPMMYLALSYDHRLIDGREAVQFLVRVKECVENPERMLLEV